MTLFRRKDKQSPPVQDNIWVFVFQINQWIIKFTHGLVKCFRQKQCSKCWKVKLCALKQTTKQLNGVSNISFVLHCMAWRFCWKTHFEASWVVFWSLSSYKELKLTTNRFTGRTLSGLLIQMQNISLRSSGMRRKQNFDSFWV